MNGGGQTDGDEQQRLRLRRCLRTCWGLGYRLLAVGCGRHIGAMGIVKSQSGGDESVEAEAEAAAVDALRFRHIGLEVIIRRLVAEVEAAAVCGAVR